MPSPYVSNYGVETITDATLAVTAAGYAGKMIVSDLAATQTFTLPAATGSGNRYSFSVATTKTGDLIIAVNGTPGTDVMQGGVIVATDTGGITVPTAATSDTLTMSGTTTGGVKGSVCHFTDIESGTWIVEGFLISTGAEATPFSADVS